MNNIQDDSKMVWVIKCQHCNNEYEEGTPEAEFIGWHGLCAECELKAQRLEDEFIQAVLKEVYYGNSQSMQATKDAARCAYRKLSGELKMPEVQK